jgi:hypothetical protein
MLVLAGQRRLNANGVCGLVLAHVQRRVDFGKCCKFMACRAKSTVVLLLAFGPCSTMTCGDRGQFCIWSPLRS